MNLSQATPPNLFKTIMEVANVIGSQTFPTGERAALRRMAPGQPPPLAFYRFAVRYLPEDWEHHRDDWLTLLAGIALMSPKAHDPDRGLGRALAEAQFSETRLERLLAAQGATRRTLLLRAARFLASKGVPFNWGQAALLLLTRDERKQEELYQKIARDFYQQQGKE